MDIGMCDWVTLLYSRKLTAHCKPAIKIKIIKIKKMAKRVNSILYVFTIIIKKMKVRH